MRDPFKVTGPTCISFSGGRTSAYMLWRVLQSNGGLPAGCVVAFANTGKEEEATLRFVRECATRWRIPITWLERPAGGGFTQTSFAKASRKGEPFDQLIRERNYLPNPVARFCTVELKILPAARLMEACGFEEWDVFIGFRADEPKRVAGLRSNPSGGTKGVDRHAPLASIGVGRHDIKAFWASQPFDLELPDVGGKTMHGNCDLCFLKPPAQRLSLVREKPSRVVWWAAKEGSIQSSGQIEGDGARFTKDGPSYAQLAAFADQQGDFFDADQEAIDCMCGETA